MPRRPKVLTYHSVLAHRDGERLFEYVQPTVAEFEEQVRFLKSHCTPIDVDTYLDVVTGTQRCPRNAVLVTFDDGFAGTLRAARVMRRYGVPSVLFLAVDYVGTHRWPWYLALDRTIESAGAQRIEWRGESFALDRLAQRKVFRERFKTLYLAAPVARRGPLLTELAKALDVTLPDAPDGEMAFLDWDAARDLALDDPLLEIGSHGLSHHDLTTLEDADLWAEMERSRAIIHERTGRDPRLFAYPDGRHDPRVRAAAGAAYRAAFALRDGRQGDPTRLPRIPAVAGGAEAVKRVLSPWSGPRERLWRWRARRGWIR